VRHRSRDAEDRHPGRQTPLSGALVLPLLTGVLRQSPDTPRRRTEACGVAPAPQGRPGPGAAAAAEPGRREEAFAGPRCRDGARPRSDHCRGCRHDPFSVIDCDQRAGDRCAGSGCCARSRRPSPGLNGPLGSRALEGSPAVLFLVELPLASSARAAARQTSSELPSRGGRPSHRVPPIPSPISRTVRSGGWSGRASQILASAHTHSQTSESVRVVDEGGMGLVERLWQAGEMPLRDGLYRPDDSGLHHMRPGLTRRKDAAAAWWAPTRTRGSGARTIPRACPEPGPAPEAVHVPHRAGRARVPARSYCGAHRRSSGRRRTTAAGRTATVLPRSGEQLRCSVTRSR
jgi:hypothetical protein